MEEQNGKKEQYFVASALLAIPFVLVVQWIWPGTIPFTTFEFWTWKGNYLDFAFACLPLLAWATAISVLSCIINGESEEMKKDPEKFLLFGGVISVWAGVAEEICFRWLFFYSAIIGYQITNYFLCGFPSWLYLYVIGYVANVGTLGLMKPYVFSELGWFVGAAMISTNGRFRDGHAYQGLFGYVNSWYGGMYLFYVALNYGLIPAMAIHFAYNFTITVIRYGFAKWNQRKAVAQVS